MNGRSFVPALALGVVSSVGGIYAVLAYGWRITLATEAEKDDRERAAQISSEARPNSSSPTSRLAGIRSGEIQLRDPQGFSFDHQETLEAGSASADVVFRRLSASNASVSLEALRGIRSLSGVRAGLSAPTTSTLALFDSIVAVDPREIELFADEPTAARDPRENVFVVQTIREGWAKLAIIDRTEASDTNEASITVRYVFNPREPIFEPGATASRVVRGFRLRD